MPNFISASVFLSFSLNGRSGVGMGIWIGVGLSHTPCDAKWTRAYHEARQRRARYGGKLTKYLNPNCDHSPNPRLLAIVFQFIHELLPLLRVSSLREGQGCYSRMVYGWCMDGVEGQGCCSRMVYGWCRRAGLLFEPERRAGLLFEAECVDIPAIGVKARTRVGFGLLQGGYMHGECMVNAW